MSEWTSDPKWTCPHPATLGFPQVPEEAYFAPKGKLIPWIPYMKTDLGADWYLIKRVPSEIQAFIDNGGDPEKVIVHHMDYDEGVIEALWSEEYFTKWCDRLTAWGINHIWPPDFSTWVDWPIAEQIFNLFRSQTVAADFARQGFRLLPYYFMSPPQTMGLMFDARPVKVDTLVVDGSHTFTNALNKKLFTRFARELSKRVECDRVLVWGRTPKAARLFHKETGKGEWLKNRMYARSVLMKAMNAKT